MSSLLGHVRRKTLGDQHKTRSRSPPPYRPQTRPLTKAVEPDRCVSTVSISPPPRTRTLARLKPNLKSTAPSRQFRDHNQRQLPSSRISLDTYASSTVTQSTPRSDLSSSRKTHARKSTKTQMGGALSKECLGVKNSKKEQKPAGRLSHSIARSASTLFEHRENASTSTKSSLANRRKNDLHIEMNSTSSTGRKTTLQRVPRGKSLMSMTLPNIRKVKSYISEHEEASSKKSEICPQSTGFDSTNVSSSRRLSISKSAIRNIFSHEKHRGKETTEQPDDDTGTPESIEPPQPPSRRHSLLPSLTIRHTLHTAKISNNPSLLVSRAPYGPQTQRMKLAALKRTPGLALLPLNETDCPARDLLRCGVNAFRAEVLDMNAMTLAMEEHRLSLTHDVIARFFDWHDYFLEYLDRYLLLEEDIFFRWGEEHYRLRGDMRRVVRMELRGRLQKAMHDIAATRDEFRPNLPAGEKIWVLAKRVASATELTVEYSTRFMGALVPFYAEVASRVDLDRLRRSALRYIMTYGGAEDDLVMYTRWMTGRELSRWKLRYIPTQYAMYRVWARDIYDEHLEISCDFADQLWEENSESQVTVEAEEWEETFRRAQIGMAKFRHGQQ